MPVSETCPARPADPAPVVSLGRYFFFPSLGLGDSQLHPPPEATGEATLTPEALVLRFRAWPDELRFELDRARLPGPAAWAAPYALRSLAQPLAPASVCYRYARRLATRAGLSTGELATQLLGSVTITGYDARRQLLSGYYEVRVPDQPDPARAAPTGTTCTILLAGDFDNVKLRVE